jgi:hypothetical protein
MSTSTLFPLAKSSLTMLFFSLRVDKPVTEVQFVGPVRSSQHALQIGPVNITKRRPKATSVRPAQGNGKRRDAKVVAPAPPNEFGRLGRKSFDRIKTTETLKFSASVGAE